MTEPDLKTADTTGRGRYYTDPLWRVTVELTEVERDLLQTWWVRRLGLVAHAGAASLYTTQTTSRLEHSLGVLGLVAHFRPTDRVARVAALLHDIGHYPFSHSLEGLAGGDRHHVVGRQRLNSLAPVLRRHGIDAIELGHVLDGSVPSPVSSKRGLLSLDHLDGIVRSGHSHGRTNMSAPTLLRQLSLDGGTVACDTDNAFDVVTELITHEVAFQTSPANLTATAVVRRLTHRLLHARPAEFDLPGLTDHQLIGELLSSDATSADLTSYLTDPTSWSVERVQTADCDVVLKRIYTDLPLHPQWQARSRAITDLRNQFADLPAQYRLTRSGVGHGG